MELTSLFSYIEASPAAPQAAEETCRRLMTAGYIPLKEEESWSLAPGGNYFVRRGMSAVIAFRVPTVTPTGLMICASHSDSPSFALTPSGSVKVGDYIKLTVEKYGGMLSATWFDRPLSLAGVIGVRQADGVKLLPVTVDRDLVVIPSVAIHMNRQANEGATYNPAVDMQPLFASSESQVTVDELLAEAAGVAPENIISRQVYLYLREKPCLYGAEREFIGSARLDDLECACASLEALIHAEPTAAMPVFALFDNEEVGSATTTGADSDFLRITLDRIVACLGMSQEDMAKMLACSLTASADNAHAKHPNHPEYADANNAPRMNGGVVIKYNANRRYATDALSGALFAEICNRAGVPTQTYTNRPDLPGGSTLGSIGVTQLSVPCVDIGLAQLAMHSAFETAGAKDYAHMVNALTAFYSTAIRRDANGAYLLQ